ncbi:hypothetical protein [Alicyclobacillus ferrooxydans]|nr:hypothetical protein [Alicyclobacillus ferrooxydans]
MTIRIVQFGPAGAMNGIGLPKFGDSMFMHADYLNVTQSHHG